MGQWAARTPLGASPRRPMTTPSRRDLANAIRFLAIDAVQAPVHAVVTSEVGGAALAVLAAADRRSALAHARIRLSEPRVGTVSGTADEVRRSKAPSRRGSASGMVENR